MLAKYKRLFIMLISVFFILTACWDSRDIQEKDIATAVITDYDNGVYSFLVEIANIRGSKKSNGGGESSNKFDVIKSQGSSFPSARYSLDRKADSPLFLGATRAIVVTDRLAEHGIEEYINRIRGTTDYRQTIDVVTTSSSPEDIFKVQPENDISAGFAIEDTLETIRNNGQGIHVNVGNVLQALTVKKVGFLLSQINAEGGEIMLTGYSIFKDTKMVGHIPAEENKGLIYLLSPHAKFIYDVEYKDNKLAIETTLKKHKVIPYYDQNNLKFKIHLEFEGQILYMSKLSPVSDELKNKYEEVLRDLIYKDVSSTLEKAQKRFECDYLEFYKHFRIYYPQAFKTIKWNEAFSQADMEIDIKVEVKAAGMYDIDPQNNK
jgi:Ger(x)C family germination protein